MYQDECYPLYCNSTRTWRMTCPCRGDLCNGPNTERELDAFAGLAKLVARTQNTRLKRALINTAGFINMNTNGKNRIDNTTVEEVTNSLNNLTDNNEADDKTNENLINDTNTTVDTDIKDVDIQIDTTAANVPPDVKENQMVESTTVVNVEIKNSESTTNSPNDITEGVIKTNDGHMNETTIQIDIPSANIESRDLKTEIIIMSSETTKLLNDTKLQDTSNANVYIPDVPTTSELITQAAIESKTMAETTTEATKTTPSKVKINENQMKPSEPSATVKTTSNPNLRETATVIPRNNTAVRVDAQILTLAIGVVLNYKI